MADDDQIASGTRIRARFYQGSEGFGAGGSGTADEQDGLGFILVDSDDFIQVDDDGFIQVS